MPEYWLIDLTNDIVEVRRRPQGGAYTVCEERAQGTLTPEALPSVQVGASPDLHFPRGSRVSAP